MSKAKKANKQDDVPTLAEVAPKASSQQLSGDLVAASLAGKTGLGGAAKGVAANDGGAFEQVRELLMGETIQSLRDDLNTSHRIILQRVDALGTSASSQLEALESKVSALSSSVAAEVFTRKAFADSHTQSMEISAAELKRELADFKLSADSTISKLTEDFGSQASFQAKAIENFEQAMNTQLADKSRDLGNATVAKEQLATILFDAAAVFADPESAPPAANS